MNMHNELEEKEELVLICEDVRNMIENKEYRECDICLQKIIGKYPHSAVPHNLYGLLFENEGEHVMAMCHFRAAWALDPTYLPARYNLETYGMKTQHSKGAYDESDCPKLYEAERIRWI